MHQFWRLSYYNRPGIWGLRGVCIGRVKECSFCVGKLFSKKHSKIFSPCPLFGSAVLSVVRLLKASRPCEGLNLSPLDRYIPQHATKTPPALQPSLNIPPSNSPPPLTKTYTAVCVYRIYNIFILAGAFTNSIIWGQLAGKDLIMLMCTRAQRGGDGGGFAEQKSFCVQQRAVEGDI